MAQEAPTHPNRLTVSWERLEAKRGAQLGLSSPRHYYNVTRTRMQDTDNNQTKDALRASMNSAAVAPQSAVGCPVKSNSMAPWSSLGKPTCGYFFTDQTDNKKKNFGIPPSNLVKWRQFSAN